MRRNRFVLLIVDSVTGNKILSLDIVVPRKEGSDVEHDNSGQKGSQKQSGRGTTSLCRRSSWCRRSVLLLFFCSAAVRTEPLQNEKIKKTAFLSSACTTKVSPEKNVISNHKIPSNPSHLYCWWSESSGLRCLKAFP